MQKRASALRNSDAPLREATLIITCFFPSWSARSDCTTSSIPSEVSFVIAGPAASLLLPELRRLLPDA
eukprot:6930845-Prymnesium_polylepis.1